MQFLAQKTGTLQLDTSLQRVDGRQSPASVLVVICAHNESQFLPLLLNRLKEMEVLVIDDGSDDETATIARDAGATVLSHERRMGKAAALADAISYALERGYEVVVEIGADAMPDKGAIMTLAALLSHGEIGGASARQIPIGRDTVAFRIDELMWSVLAHGKKQQMLKSGDCHLGAVLYAFKPHLVNSIEGSVNDDEQVGASLKLAGRKRIFADDVLVHFDASVSIGHILQRRRRMYFGHMLYLQSAAPSMDPRVVAVAFVKAITEKQSRIVWAIPALLVDFYARMLAWNDIRKPGMKAAYSRWITTYAKNSLFVRKETRKR